MDHLYSLRSFKGVKTLKMNHESVPQIKPLCNLIFQSGSNLFGTFGGFLPPYKPLRRWR